MLRRWRLRRRRLEAELSPRALSLRDERWHVLRVEGPFGLFFCASPGPTLEPKVTDPRELVTVAHPPPLDHYAAERLAKVYEARADRIAMAEESFDPSEEGDDEF